MRRMLFPLCALCLFSFRSYAADSDLAWAKSAGGTLDDMGSCIAALADGSALVTGVFQGTATFGLGEANETTLISPGRPAHLMTDFFIARYNANGTLTWAKSAGGTRNTYCKGAGIATLANGSALVTGGFRGTVTFGSVTLTSESLFKYFNDDIFVARYNANGTVAWAKSAGATDQEGWASGTDIGTLADGSALVTGSFENVATFGLGEEKETTLTAAGHLRDFFIARYNANGTLAWAKSAGGWMSHADGYGIATLANGSALVTGEFADTAVFGLGEEEETTLTSPGAAASFIARYNADGTLAWAKCAGGAGGQDIAALADGSALVTGYFSNTATFGPSEANETALTSAGGRDIFIALYNPNGLLRWAKRVGGTRDDEGHGIATLADGSALVTGYFQGSATFGPGTTLTGGGAFIARYYANGTLAWAKRADSSKGSGIATLADGSVLVTGSFSDTATFGPGEGNETALTVVGGEDIFIAKFNRFVDVVVNGNTFTPNDPLTVGVMIRGPVKEPSDGYLLADTPIGVFSIMLNGAITPGIIPAAEDIQQIGATFKATVLRNLPVPASIRGRTTLYLVLVNAGKIPPVPSLSALQPYSPYVILMSKETIVVEYVRQLEEEVLRGTSHSHWPEAHQKGTAW